MDRVDIKILGQLNRGVSKIDFRPDVKGLYGTIATKIGLDYDTVRNRVDRLKSTGIVRGWQLVVNPYVFGLRTYAVWMKVDSHASIHEVVRKIRLVQGVLAITGEMGNVFSVALACEDDQAFKKKVELICELTGGKELMKYAVAHPGTGFELTSNDWQIIKALKSDPLARHVRVAKMLGLSSKTVQRRITRLIHGSVIFFLLDIDFTHLEGASCVNLSMYYTDRGFRDQIESSVFTKFEDYVLQVAWADASHGYFEFVIPNVHIVQEIVHWTRALRGVGEVKVNLNYDRQNFWDEALAELTAGKVKGIPVLRAA